jgi:hypothetical protein
LVLGAPRALFPIANGALSSDPKPNAGWPDFDVSADGTRLLASSRSRRTGQPLTAVINGIAAIGRR